MGNESRRLDFAVVRILQIRSSYGIPPTRVLPFLHGLVGPSRWSHTELSRVVELPLRYGDQSVSPAMRTAI